MYYTMCARKWALSNLQFNPSICLYEPVKQRKSPVRTVRVRANFRTGHRPNPSREHSCFRKIIQ